MEKGLLEKTGKSLEHWTKVVNNAPYSKHGEIVKFLKSEYGFTHGYANFVALKAKKGDAASHDPAELVSGQYARGKEHLRPIYELFLKEVSAFGEDITVTPKKEAVSFIRNKQFALFKPATKTRIDLGLKLKGKEVTERLENSGPFGAMCTHRVRLEVIEDIDEEVLSWVREAYEKAT